MLFVKANKKVKYLKQCEEFIIFSKEHKKYQLNTLHLFRDYVIIFIQYTKERYQIKMKKEKGITTIGLVVTIIVMIILN